MMLDFDFHDQRKELEAGAFLIVAAVLAFLAAFAFVVVQIYRLWIGISSLGCPVPDF